MSATSKKLAAALNQVTSSLDKVRKANARERTLRRATSESQILRDIREALGRESDLVLWRLSQGGTVVRGDSKWRAGLSVNGAADLIGIVTVKAWVDPVQRPLGLQIGRFFALEVKAPRGTIRPEQKLFLELVRKRGGFAAIVRSVDEARQALERARRGENQ